MKLYTVASNKNRLNEAILIDDTKYSLIEKNKKKCYKVASSFLYSLVQWHIMTAKLKCANMPFLSNREILIPQTLSVLQCIPRGRRKYTVPECPKQPWRLILLLRVDLEYSCHMDGWMT